ncbi:PH domain-containing protein [Mumia sp. zg.B53]|uniref:PH domain-containing protein n=1 Tax=unclassified Mumia TaxID=2621872 RepID=UPI001C6DE35D|nr:MULTISPECIES: PH domain-containing protein [unclassified Mumia]MBW9205609.1 PH domain-containing protein [Mumia sp. zg.B17]MBW9208389.1 PH domain-containing protein [Mumia sp. zg.B21]MBW9216347.1 PH domain-containing protein [Mumia sp. zg.B53]MDD9348873.1 PH domain-containing protein [Mumia sp.]
MDPLFAPPAETWHPVSVKLRTLHRLVLVLWTVVPAVVVCVALALLLQWWWPVAAVAGVAVAVLVWGWFWAARNQAAWGFAENAEDLWIRHGVAWRKIVAVPYGRVQYVDVTAGPLERSLGIAKVSLHTASSHTSAVIPGIPSDEAARLRDRLTELRKTRGSGI